MEGLKGKSGEIINKRKKSLPIGIDDFKEMITKNYYYFDKTDLIENILDEQAKVMLFTS